MKKIFIGLAVLVLSSCYMKGDYTLGRRNMFNDFFYTYNIHYYDEDAAESVDTEVETISNYKIGVAKHAVPGGIVFSSKMISKEVFSNEYLRPNHKGAMVSNTVPVEFSDEQVYKAIGEVKIEGTIYRLLEPNRYGDVVLIDFNGSIYPRIGRIYNNRLALLDTRFLKEPHDIKFVNETQNRNGEENVVSSIEVRYQGLEDYYMVFSYKTIAADGAEAIEEQKTYRFPMYDKTVSFEGITLDILEADDAGIDYKVMEI
jgi:hypothetical protein